MTIVRLSLLLVLAGLLSSAALAQTTTQSDPHEQADEAEARPAAAQGDHAEHEESALFEASEFMGKLTLALLATTVLLAVLRRKNPRKILPIHKACGLATLVSGAIHGGIMLLAV